MAVPDADANAEEHPDINIRDVAAANGAPPPSAAGHRPPPRTTSWLRWRVPLSGHISEPVVRVTWNMYHRSQAADAQELVEGQMRCGSAACGSKGELRRPGIGV